MHTHIDTCVQTHTQPHAPHMVSPQDSSVTVLHVTTSPPSNRHELNNYKPRLEPHRWVGSAAASHWGVAGALFGHLSSFAFVAPGVTAPHVMRIHTEVTGRPAHNMQQQQHSRAVAIQAVSSNCPESSQQWLQLTMQYVSTYTCGRCLCCASAPVTYTYYMPWGLLQHVEPLTGSPPHSPLQNTPAPACQHGCVRRKIRCGQARWL